MSPENHSLELECTTFQGHVEKSTLVQRTRIVEHMRSCLLGHVAVRYANTIISVEKRKVCSLMKVGIQLQVTNKSGDGFQNGADVTAMQTSHEIQSGDRLNLPTLHSSNINMKTAAENASIWKDIPLTMATAAVGTPGPQPINMDLMTILL
ncbi:hypothetical protein C0J52_23078 [Blattella germanica]|nr:hypothetical protein C0J52_23078 [Blattella germanica]